MVTVCTECEVINMTSPNAEFCQNPLDFLKKNVIIPHNGRIEVQGEKKKVIKKGKEVVVRPKIVTGYFTLEEYESAQVGGAAERVFWLSYVGPEPSEKLINAYWLAYEDNQTKWALLEKEANYMFTAKMTGCSFGYGSRTESGAVLVCHANATDYGKKKADQAVEELAERTDIKDKEHKAREIAAHLQAREQARRIERKMEPEGILASSKYRNPEEQDLEKEYSATVVGLRDTRNDKWTFWCQRLTRIKNRLYVLQDVIQI